MPRQSPPTDLAARVRTRAMPGLVLLTLLMQACTLSALQRQEQADEVRVADKEAALAAERSRSSTLEQQRVQLTDEITSRKMSLAELERRITALQSANQQAGADLAAKREQQTSLLRRVEQLNGELAQLRNSPQSGTADAQARVVFLKKQLDQQLELLLH